MPLAQRISSCPEYSIMASCRARLYVLALTCLVSGVFYLFLRSTTFRAMLNPVDPPPPPQLILVWDRHSPFLDIKPYHLRREVPRKQLGDCNCHITSDAGAWKLADAILVDAFYLRRLNDFTHFFPKRRAQSQLWVFYMLEPAQILTENRDRAFFHRLNNQFNLTMTYRRDSDVPIGYGLIRPFFVDETNNRTRHAPPPATYRDYSAGKSHVAAWFVSNCQAKSGRLDFAHELQKHMSVDIFGDCGPFKCPNATVGDCNKMLNRHYKFYLSFESAVCKDYISEKFFNPLLLDVVPIVLGGGNYTAIHAPPQAYIDVRNFASVKELADYLLYLDATPTAYNAYFEWKNDWKTERVGVYSKHLCHLCHKLDEIAKVSVPVERRYPDMVNWWHEQADCRRGTILNGTWRT